MTTFSLPTKAYEQMERMLCRLRHPVSLPQEVADAVGFRGGPVNTFCELMLRLTSPGCVCHHLCRMMPREVVEELFDRAVRKEDFGLHSIYSYYFRQGYLEFVLHYDELGRLRRVYLQHKSIVSPGGQELILRSPQSNVDAYHFS